MNEQVINVRPKAGSFWRRRWLWRVVLAVVLALSLASAFVARMVSNLSAGDDSLPGEMQALLAQPLAADPFVISTASGDAATSATIQPLPDRTEGPAIFPVHQDRLIDLNQALKRLHRDWQEDHADAAMLNTRLVPLDNSRSLLPIRPEYNEKQQELAGQINAAYADLQNSLRQFQTDYAQGASFDVLYRSLVNAQNQAYTMDDRGRKLATEPLPNKIVDGKMVAMSRITDIWTYELLMITGDEAARFTRVMIPRLALEHERWDVLVLYTSPSQRLPVIRRMQGAQRYIRLAEWTWEYQVEPMMSGLFRNPNP